MYHKLLAIAALAALALGARAENGNEVMVFAQSSGAIHTISATDLQITFAGTSLVAVNGQESIELPLSTLSKFYFADSSEASTLATIYNRQSKVSVYAIDGKFEGEFSSMESCLPQLTPGVYVINDGVSSIKITVK